jgi:hypothetical protein
VQASYTGAGFVDIAHYLESVTYAIEGAAAMQSSDLRSTAGSGRPSVKLRVAMRSMRRLDEIASDATSSHIGRASQLFVAHQTCLHDVELCAYHPERVAAEQEVLRRLRHIHQSEDRRRSPVRIA